ncbi:MAG: serine hydroxymethyltransferase [Erysipelotrichaceae bacterium]|nr:serine hydroxymethyltransferase [Erysipelotrichaceae bacterium]
MTDTVIKDLIRKEEERQHYNIELIASENYCSKEVMEAVGSCLTNKYAEGYPGKRYYGGCFNVDEIEELARKRACELFKAEHANVQPHCGSAANMAVYRCVLKPGDKILGMSLDAGGHLTHGYKLSFSGQDYETYSYGVNKETEMIDYDEVERLAMEIKPKIIVAGASAYARFIDYKRFREICDKCGALLMVDMAHVAGLIAAGLHPSPVEYADFVTSTTHKTLRGPRGGLILCKEEYAKDLDRSVFPGIQGGPLCHVIAGKAVCFHEAMDESFVEYQKQVIKNAKVLCETLKKEGFRIVSGQTDNHMVLVDVKNSIGITGKQLEQRLDEVNITVNKNSIPFDEERPAYTSGVRLGTPAMTTRGFKEEEFIKVGEWISLIAHHIDDEEIKEKVKKEVRELMERFAWTK